MTRRDEILKLIVEHFIKTAEPVGSKTLQSAYGLKVSSATIRNEMNALETEGLLEKTHASSGRVPSEAGYRYYIDHIRTASVDERAKYAIAQVLDERSKSVEQVIRESCEILSNLTNLASAVLGSKVDEEKLLSVSVVPLGEKTATVVFVTDKGYVENKTFVLSENVRMDDLVSAMKLIGERLSGTPVSQLAGKMESMKPVLTDYAVGQDAIYRTLLEAFVKFAGERLSLYGKDALFDQPEFSNDPGKLRQLYSFLDDPGALRSAVGEGMEKDGVTVHLGKAEEGLEDLAIVSAGITLPGEAGASLSVLGPKRMDYARVSAILKYMAESIDRYFGRSGGEEEWKNKNSTEKPAPAAKKSSKGSAKSPKAKKKS